MIDEQQSITTTTVEPFVLPRLDWHDDEGRIYKDALIENFNAIEARLKELGSLGESVISENTAPNTSDIHLDDVTMDDIPNKILNFKSFLNAVNILNYPLECTFNGKKLVRLTYYNSSYEYKIITNQSLSCNDTSKYIYLNYNTAKVAASSSSTTPANSILIGCYADGAIRGLSSMEYSNINVIYYLARMSENLYNYSFTSGDRDNISLSTGITIGGRCIGGCDTNTRTRGEIGMTFRDVGRS